MPKGNSTPQEEGEASDTDAEYEQWKRGGKEESEAETELKDPPESKAHVKKDRRVLRRADINHYRKVDHQWLTKTPFYIRLGKRPAMLHYLIDEHWDAQEELWNLRRQTDSKSNITFQTTPWTHRPEKQRD